MKGGCCRRCGCFLFVCRVLAWFGRAPIGLAVVCGGVMGRWGGGDDVGQNGERKKKLAIFPFLRIGYSRPFSLPFLPSLCRGDFSPPFDISLSTGISL